MDVMGLMLLFVTVWGLWGWLGWFDALREHRSTVRRMTTMLRDQNQGWHDHCSRLNESWAKTCRAARGSRHGVEAGGHSAPDEQGTDL